ncbi:MAG: ribonuclease HI [Sedimentisphaeraceae bacterium JB056]
MDKVIIYTDGGCSPNPGPGGWGAVLISPSLNHEKQLYGSEPDSTNNRMELTAAIKALEALKRPCKVQFFTDSQYLQKAFTQGWLESWQKKNWRTAAKKPVKNKDLWLELLDLTSTHQIEWQWVKGHSNNKYNEMCDQLVHKARSEMKSK